MALAHIPTTLPQRRVYRKEYLPESDGKPMAETDVHLNLLIALRHALKQYFRARSDVYVSGNIFLYYRDTKGRRKNVSPDILVVFGVNKKERRIYKLEDEGKAPDVVVELISTETKEKDLGERRYIYAALGVKEYYIFDPLHETLQPALRGYQLVEGEYMLMAGTSLLSQAMGLELREEEGTLRLYDPLTGMRLLTPDEAEAARDESEVARSKAEIARRAAETARRAAEERATNETAQRQAVEAELARLREELVKLRG